MAQLYNSQLDAFALYHKIHEPNETLSILEGPALPAIGHAIAGSTGAAISNVFTYPLDLIITRRQVQRQLYKKSSSNQEHEYKSIADAASKIYANEGGIAGLYTGLLQDTTKTVADSFLFFLAYNFLRQSRLQSQKNGVKNLPALDELSVGFLAGAFAKFLTTPISNIVTRMQTSSMLGARDKGKHPATSATVRSIATQIRSEKGLLGFWSGYSASLVLTLNPSLTFFLFETFKRTLLPRTQRADPSPQATFLLAAISKAIASTITYPFSLAKTRAQISSTVVDHNYDEVKDAIESASNGTTDGTRPGRVAARRTVFSTIIQIAQTEGISALYEGLGGEVLKGFFSHGITMLVKDAVHTFIIRLYFALLKVLKRAPSPHQLVHTTKDQASQSLDSLKSGIHATQQRGQELLEKGAAQASSSYTTAKSAAQDSATYLQNRLGSTSGQASEAATNAYSNTRDRGASALTSTKENVSFAVQSTASSLQPSLSSAVDSTSDSARNAYERGHEIGTKAINSAAETAKSAAAATTAAIPAPVEDTTKQITDAARRQVEPVAEYVGRRTEQLGRAIRPEKAEGAGEK
ncbi:hypothetical protein MMC11_004001 [Xylographa trunciseda]|nr:hypothetical protein [Xylographa trunciseda]